MLFKKIFKPKWQNGNPEIRQAAVAQLDWEACEDRKILESVILKDADAGVVKLALSKVTQVKALLRAINNTSEATQNDSRARLIQLTEDAQNDADRFIRHALERGSTEILTELTTELKEESCLPQLLTLLGGKSPALLATLAADHPLSQVRQMAAERLDDPALLADVAAKIKTKDKGVYQKVKTKLQAYRQREQDIVSQQKRLENLCNSVEVHAITDATKYYTEKLKTLERSYTDYQAIGDQEAASQIAEPLRKRIESALGTCRERAEEFERLLRADHKQKQDIEHQASERLNTIEQLNNVIAQLKESPANNSAGLAALDGLIKTQQIRWQEATRGQSVSDQEVLAYQYATHELNHYVSAHTNLHNHSAEINDLLEVASRKLESGSSVDRDLLRKLRKCVNKIEWPEGFCLPEILQRATDIAGQIQTIQTRHTEDLSKLRKKTENKILKLADHIADGELKQALRLSKAIHAELPQFPAKIRQQLNNQWKAQQINLDELKDWQGYATLPKQKSLCDRMEYLAGQHLEPHIKAQRIKELQSEWRSLGGSPDQKLWQKFKNFADLAFEPCREFFSEEDKLKEANLQKRKAICDQLAEFLEQVDWQTPDWKAVDRINKRAREEWRLYYPVDHKTCKPVQLRFNRLLSALDEKLNAERENNHRSKRIIIEQANLLLETENTREATAKAKSLQKQWQLVGITDHKTDRELWSAFREACDKIFGKLEAHQKQQKLGQQNALSRASDLTRATIELSNNIDDSSESALSSFIEAFARIDGMGDGQKAAAKTFQGAVNQVRKALAKHKMETFRSYYERLINCAFNRSLDEFSAAGTAEADSPAATNSPPIRIRPEHQALFSAQPHQDAEPASDALLRMEIMSEIESPDSEKGRRMALQVARLAEGMASGNSKDKDLLDQFETYLTSWIAMSQPADLQPMQHRRLLNILDRIVNKATG